MFGFRNKRERERIEQQEYTRRVRAGDPIEPEPDPLAAHARNPRLDHESFERYEQKQKRGREIIAGHVAEHRKNAQNALPLSERPAKPYEPLSEINDRSDDWHPLTETDRLVRERNERIRGKADLALYNERGEFIGYAEGADEEVRVRQEEQAIANMDAKRDAETVSEYVGIGKDGHAIYNRRSKPPESVAVRQSRHARAVRPLIHHDIIGGSRSFSRSRDTSGDAEKYGGY